MQPPGRASRWLGPCGTRTPREGDPGGAATRDRVRGHNDTPRTRSPGAVATPVLSPCLARRAVGAKTCRKRQKGQRCPAGTQRGHRMRQDPHGFFTIAPSRLGSTRICLVGCLMVLKAVLLVLFSQGTEPGFCLLGLFGLGNWEPALGTGKGSELGACSAPLRKPALVFPKASRQHRSHRPRGPESTPG